jgi:hypothetical protein
MGNLPREVSSGTSAVVQMAAGDTNVDTVA